MAETTLLVAPDSWEPFPATPSSSSSSSAPSTPEVIPQKRVTTVTKEKKPTVEELAIPLHQYIALGCFCFEDPSIENSTDTSELQADWQELRDYLPEVTNVEVPWKALVSLWRAYWLRVLSTVSRDDPLKRIWRIYLLPDDLARTSVDRNGQTLRKSLNQVLEIIDVSSDTWNGNSASCQPINFDRGMTSEDSSLFYIFNTLPSPEPNPDLARDRFSKLAMQELLEYEQPVRGLSATLYPYQRRSAATMLQREVAPQMQLDPRLEARTSPSGQTFYYGARDLTFLREPRLYDTVRGGILAETMGLGKTVICIALLLATKDHWPRVPPIYAGDRIRRRENVASLLETAAAALSRHPIPWRKALDDHHERTGEELANCIKVMEEQEPMYEIPPVPIRSNRSSTFATPPEQIRICKTTIIVVPRNLVLQWQSELAKHVEEGILKVLVMENTKQMMPSVAEIATYDLILFSRPRFEAEAKGHLDDLYESPLKKLHFLRIVIDEGHSFASTNTNATIVADRLVRAERRWIVSGTPAKDLMGVEVEMEALEYEGDSEDTKIFRQESLEQRKTFNAFQEAQGGAIKAFGILASRFLKAQPWAVSSHGAFQEAAKWEDYIYRHETFQTKTFTGFTKTLRRTLETLVIKTQPDDVERDINLPPLTHKIVRLEPSFYDKLTANLFVLLFMSNAITSERTDQDYLFHAKSNAHLQRLTANLRQSAFTWTGLTEEAVTSTLDVTERYLAKEGITCSAEDRELMAKTAAFARLALDTPGWRAISRAEEMGLFVQDWPNNAVQTCAFHVCHDPPLIGITEVNECQKYINNHLTEEDPAAELPTAREAAHIVAEQEKAEALWAAQARAPKKNSKEKDNEMVKSGIPLSSFYNENLGNKRLPASGASSSPKKTPKRKASALSAVTPSATTIPSTSDTTNPASATNLAEEKTKAKRKPRQRLSTGDTAIDLDPSTPLGATRLIGTTSSKFSYLISRVLALHKDEKILIFYSGNHIAWYLSQALDLFSIKHLIYASQLAGAARSKYIVLFDTDPNHRVMLMDIKQAAHGLNLSSASRVFFVNPVCNPAVEAQAIKRAHRIGQTNPVVVETLILTGTIEEKMWERSRVMTRMEHAKASRSLTDDWGMTRIIQEARCIPIRDDEKIGMGQLAPLEVPEQIFGRPGRNKGEETGLEKELFGAEEKKGRRAELAEEEGNTGSGTSGTAGKKKRSRNAAVVNIDDEEGASSSTPKPKRARPTSREKRPTKSSTRIAAAAPAAPDTAAPFDTPNQHVTQATATARADEDQDVDMVIPQSVTGPSASQDYNSIFGGGS